MKKRSKFSLSHTKLLTMNMGKIVPLTWMEVLPGDTFQHATNALVRVSPLVSPVMHPVRIRIHHFYCPLRILWDDAGDFFTGGEDGLALPEHPTIELASVSTGDLADYLGVPPHSYSPSLSVSALPFRMMAKVYNEFYRDQDLEDKVDVSTASGVDTTTSTDLLNASWEKDYFTTCRPFEAKGSEVSIPLGDSAPVKGIGKANQTFTFPSQLVYESDGTTPTYGAAADFSSADINRTWFGEAGAGGVPNIRADLSAATGISLADLRTAFAVEKFQENRARWGSRLSEYYRSLGVPSSDGRLQNPEYLGGGRQVIQFSEVLQTAEGTDPVASMKGHGLGALRSNRYRRFFEEHGIIMSFMSVLPKTIYCDSLHRGFLRSTKETYFTKEFQFVGEQTVTNREVQANHSSPDDTFGYIPRYDEYRFHPSTISGEFRNTLDHWHYARIFSGDVALNSSFINAVPTDRVYASTATDQLYVLANHSVQARRLMAKYPKSKII